MNPIGATPANQFAKPPARMVVLDNHEASESQPSHGDGADWTLSAGPHTLHL